MATRAPGFPGFPQAPIRDPCGTLTVPSTQSAPPICLPTQRRVEDSRALHLVAIQFHAAVGLLRPRADVRAGELLLFILSFFSCLLPGEGRGGGVG